MTEVPRDLVAKIGLADVMEVLRPYGACIASTFPLGLAVPGSDVDILCEAQDPAAFRAHMQRAFGRESGFSLHRKDDATPPAIVCRFSLNGLPVEIFGQPLPVREQRGYRHLVAEQRLLAAGGERDREAIRALRAAGLKTEPAFAQCFGLGGDPYEVLLAVRDWSDAQIADVAAGWRRRASAGDI